MQFFYIFITKSCCYGIIICDADDDDGDGVSSLGIKGGYSKHFGLPYVCIEEYG